MKEIDELEFRYNEPEDYQAAVVGQIRLFFHDKIIVTDIIELQPGDVWVEFLWGDGRPGTHPYRHILRESSPI